LSAAARESMRVEGQPKTVRFEVAGRTVRITLCRPQVRNAFNAEMIRDLRSAFAQVPERPEARVVVLTGEGDAFCAGADLHWMGQVLDFTYEENYQDSLNLARLLREIYDCPRPVIGRINGPAIGGGTGLAAVCDLTVAAESATFSFSEVKIGLVPACISPYVLQRVGQRYAREFFLTGERLPAQRGLECGLYNKVVPAGQLDAAVAAYEELLLGSGPEALAVCKRMIREVSPLDLDRAGPLTAEIIARLRLSEEGQEGMKAFLERRPPRWRTEG
jgi:methylglutaconyl-CoA hydratase